MNENIYKIYTKKMAYKLRQAGCVIVGTEPNKQKPQFDVYLFRDDEKFREEMTRLNNK